MRALRRPNSPVLQTGACPPPGWVQIPSCVKGPRERKGILSPQASRSTLPGFSPAHTTLARRTKAPQRLLSDWPAAPKAVRAPGQGLSAHDMPQAGCPGRAGCVLGPSHLNSTSHLGARRGPQESSVSRLRTKARTPGSPFPLSVLARVCVWPWAGCLQLRGTQDGPGPRPGL